MIRGWGPTSVPASFTTGTALIRWRVKISATRCVEASADTVITGEVMMSPAVTCASDAAALSGGWVCRQAGA